MKIPALAAACLAALLPAAVQAQIVQAQTAPAAPTAAPVAPVRPITDTYFGTTVTDPYRWLENLDDPETKAWFRGQADYTTATLSQIPGRAAMLARIQALDQGATYVTGAQAFGPYVFYQKRRPQDNNYKLYVRQGFSGAERLLVDPEALTTDAGVHSSLDYFVPSPDGKYVAYALSPGGSENSVLHVLETASGKTLSESITRAQFGNVSWLADGQSFAYVRLQQLAPGQNPNDKESDSKVFLHKLGTDADTQDTLLLGKGVNPSVAFEDIDVPAVIYSPAAPKYIFGYDGRGVQNEVALYVAPSSSLQSDPATIPWKKVCDFSDDVTTFDAHGDDLYLLSHKGASRYQVLTLKADAPDLATAKVVVPQGKTVLRGLSVASDALYVHALDAGVGRLLRVPFGGKVQSIRCVHGRAGPSDLHRPPAARRTLLHRSWDSRASLVHLQPEVRPGRRHGPSAAGPGRLLRGHAGGSEGESVRRDAGSAIHHLPEGHEAGRIAPDPGGRLRLLRHRHRPLF